MIVVRQVNRSVLVLAVAGVLAALSGAPAASAETLGPWWGITSTARPSQLPVGPCGGAEQPLCGQIVATAENLGDAGTTGKAVIEDRLPPGVKVEGVKAIAGGTGGFDRGPLACSRTTAQGMTTVSCTFEKFVQENAEGEKETVLQSLPPYELIEIQITVRVPEEEFPGGVVQNTATVTGGGAPRTKTATTNIHVGGATKFGIESYELVPEEIGGAIDTQAGSHPFQVTSVVNLNTQTPDSEGNPRSAGLPKNLIAELPAGFIGNPTPFDQCTDAQFGHGTQATVHGETGTTPINECPASSAIGVATVSFNEPATHYITATAPIFNMTPGPGEPARFGFKVDGLISVFLNTSIRSGGDYGVDVGSFNITEIDWLIGTRLTFWGAPGIKEHDHQRGWDCLQELGGEGACPDTNATAPPPFLIMPSDCEKPFESTINGDSWGSSLKPTEIAEPVKYTLPERVDGCNHLPFSPEIKLTPDGTAASTPTGVNVDVHVPQASILNNESLAESAVKDIKVAFPEGVAINPAGGDGLEACSEGLVGFTGFSGETANFTPTLPEPLEPGTNFCPDASKIGTVTIKTPLLPPGQNVDGDVYLASQNANPFGSLIALYLVAKDPISGTVVKLVGETQLTPSGQVIGIFKNSPQLAFEDAELHFFGGERAPLATPAHCGAYTTTATFGSWAGNKPVESASTFDINKGPNGTPCPGASLPFSPSLTGGTPNINAGAFSSLTTTIGREDGQQDMQCVAAAYARRPLRPAVGCEALSRSAGQRGYLWPGIVDRRNDRQRGRRRRPGQVTGGKVYITEGRMRARRSACRSSTPRRRALRLRADTSNPSQAACDCVSSGRRSKSNPHTAALTVTTDPSGPYAIPHIIEGSRCRSSTSTCTINRPGFTFNPTNCNPTSDHRHDQQRRRRDPRRCRSRSRSTNCAMLKFAPKFAVSTIGEDQQSERREPRREADLPERPDGHPREHQIGQSRTPQSSSLPADDAAESMHRGAVRSEPRRLSRGVGDRSREGGHAAAARPVGRPRVLRQPRRRSVPEPGIVLQGYGVRIVLVGATFISKSGITSTTFKTVPDQPLQHVRDHVARGQVQRARRQREPVRADDDQDGQEEGHGQGQRPQEDRDAQGHRNQGHDPDDAQRIRRYRTARRSTGPRRSG